MFLRTYLSTNAIVTLISLEEDMMDFLKGFNFPTLKIREKTYFDAQEICIDDDAENIAPSISKFVDYGIGDLLNHPQLKYLFNSSIRSTSIVSTKDVVSNLLRFLQESKLTAPLKEHTVVTIASTFPGYLCKLLAALDEDDDEEEEDKVKQSSSGSQIAEQLRTMGILLQANLSDEVLCLQHVLNSHHNLMVDITKRELLMHRQIFSSLVVTGGSKRAKRKHQPVENEDEVGCVEPVDTVSLEPISTAIPETTAPPRAYPECVPLSSLFEARIYNNHDANPSSSNSTDIECIGPDVLRPLLPYIQHDRATAKFGDKDADLKAVGR